jgi:alkylation response protein AidB-like acyl-CoA dehydrogenase
MPSQINQRAEHDAIEGPSFAETALKLGGKSEDEARRTGAIDAADDQVERLFARQYQTANSPAHRAVWDRGVPVELFASEPVTTPAEVQVVMDASLNAVRRHRNAGTLMNADGKVADTVLADLGRAGYWGLLVDREHGGAGAPFSSFAPFLTRMATIDPTVAGLARSTAVSAPSIRSAHSATTNSGGAFSRDWLPAKS